MMAVSPQLRVFLAARSGGDGKPPEDLHHISSPKPVHGMTRESLEKSIKKIQGL
jgi:hypothetical protein